MNTKSVPDPAKDGEAARPARAPNGKTGSWPCENVGALRRRRMAFSILRRTFRLARGAPIGAHGCGGAQSPKIPRFLRLPPSARDSRELTLFVMVDGVEYTRRPDRILAAADRTGTMLPFVFEWHSGEVPG